MRHRRRMVVLSLVLIPALALSAFLSIGTLARLSAGGVVVYLVILARMAQEGTFSRPDEEWYYTFTVSIFFGKSLTGRYAPKTIFAIFTDAMLVEGWERKPVERAIIRACQAVRVVYNECAPVHGQEPFEWPRWATVELDQLNISEMVRWMESYRPLQPEITLFHN